MPTKIPYCDETINPIRTKGGGWHCVKTSPGCLHCYAGRINKRFGDGYDYYENHDRKIEFVLIVKALEKPLHWKKPKSIFVQDMSDLFLDTVPSTFINDVFRMMIDAKRHTFLILTKRPERMRDFLNGGGYPTGDLVPPNILLGITAENQGMFDKRWAFLKDIPASVKWISYEPALGPLVLPDDFLALGKRGWVVCGGENGPGARPMHPNGVRSIRDQCNEAGVMFFFKGWGEWGVNEVSPTHAITNSGNLLKLYPDRLPYDSTWISRLGKKATGRLLDGQVWDQMPGE